MSEGTSTTDSEPAAETLPSVNEVSVPEAQQDRLGEVIRSFLSLKPPVLRLGVVAAVVALGIAALGSLAASASPQNVRDTFSVTKFSATGLGWKTRAAELVVKPWSVQEKVISHGSYSSKVILLGMPVGTLILAIFSVILAGFVLRRLTRSHPERRPAALISFAMVLALLASMAAYFLRETKHTYTTTYSLSSAVAFTFLIVLVAGGFSSGAVRQLPATLRSTWRLSCTCFAILFVVSVFALPAFVAASPPSDGDASGSPFTNSLLYGAAGASAALPAVTGAKISTKSDGDFNSPFIVNEYKSEILKSTYWPYLVSHFRKEPRSTVFAIASNADIPAGKWVILGSVAGAWILILGFLILNLWRTGRPTSADACKTGSLYGLCLGLLSAAFAKVLSNVYSGSFDSGKSSAYWGVTQASSIHALVVLTLVCTVVALLIGVFRPTEARSGYSWKFDMSAIRSVRDTLIGLGILIVGFVVAASNLLGS